MKIEVTITLRDDKLEKYICYDYPSLGSPFITLYLTKNLGREHLHVDSIQRVSCKIVS
jgi:hypothetical protein